MTTSFAACPTSFGGPAPKAMGSAYQCVNPYDGKPFKAFEELTDRQLETAIKSAATCFETWRNVSFSERATIVGRAAALMRAHVDHLALFFRVENEDEAVALANDSDFGLGGSVFTKDVARGKRVANRIDTGMVFINHPIWTTADLPFGGIKNSGYGRELSSLGIQEFINKKLVRTASLDGPA